MLSNQMFHAFSFLSLLLHEPNMDIFNPSYVFFRIMDSAFLFFFKKGICNFFFFQKEGVTLK